MVAFRGASLDGVVTAATGSGAAVADTYDQDPSMLEA